jgi:hypothetical protein
MGEDWKSLNPGVLGLWRRKFECVSYALQMSCEMSLWPVVIEHPVTPLG